MSARSSSVITSGCFIGIILKSAKDYPSALAKLESLDEVTEAYYTTGHYSIFIKVMCRSIDALQHVLYQQDPNN